MSKVNTTYDIVEAIKSIEQELMESMIRNMDRHRLEEEKEGMEWSQWQVEQLAALEEYKKRNAKKYKTVFEDINDQIDSLISMQRAAGNSAQEESILNAIKNGFIANRVSKGISGEFFKMNDRAINALIEATKNDFAKGEIAILRRAEDQYRQVIFNSQMYAATGATYEKAIDMATKDFLAAGINCIEYANGARHTLSDYADMALRTAQKRAYLTGEGEMRQEWGISTVIMNKRTSPCPKCLPFVGKVLIDDVWSGGNAKDGNYPLMSKAIAKGLYHPRCKDSHTTYFEGISTPPDNKWSKEELEQIGANTKAESQLNYAKRQEEKYERLSKYSLDDDNKRKYKARANQWKSIREDKENADIEKYRIGTNKVDLKYINSEEFNKKFSKLTTNSKVNDILRRYAKAMLTHRNGTDGEDLYIINSLTGDKVLSKIKGKNILGIELTEEEIRVIKNCKTKIGIHNHPTNLLPTGGDLAVAGSRKYDFGIVVTHSGRVFVYEAGNTPLKSNYFNKRVDKYVSEPYNYDIETAQMMTLDEFESEYGISWKEVE